MVSSQDEVRFERVLYVEDDEAIREITSLALRAVGGLQVLACPSGEVALREAEAFAPELLLLDVMMPGMDGLETLAALRARTALRKVPAVFLTAKVLPAEVAALKRLDVLDVLTKPFDPLHLAERLQALFSHAAADARRSDSGKAN